MRRRKPNRESTLKQLLCHPVLWFVVASVATIVVAIQVWNEYQPQILSQARFGLTAEKIQLAKPQPSWTKMPVNDLLLVQDPPPSLLDPALVAHTATKLQSVGWIEKINSIKKSASGLQIDLDYRKPIAQVFYPDDRATVAVDRKARLFDSEMLVQSEIQSLPHIRVFQPAAKNLTTWAPWPDARIKDCVALADYFGNSWPSIGFYQIVSFQAPDRNAISKPLELYSKYGSVVIWGSPPGKEVNGEASAEVKFRALAEYVLQNGSFAKSDPNLQFDLRSGRLVKTRSLKTAKEDLFFRIK